MSGKVITLDGLDNAVVDDGRPCGGLVTHISSVTGREVRVCSNDVGNLGNLPKKRGRPLGSTTKIGARRPSVPMCTSYEVKTNKRGRQYCRCNSVGNSQLQTSNKCGLK